jgi:hypothetical protein
VHQAACPFEEVRCHSFSPERAVERIVSRVRQSSGRGDLLCTMVNRTTRGRVTQTWSAQSRGRFKSVESGLCAAFAARK